MFKTFFINAFRELFLYHHGSLEFRAKLFAAVIAAKGEMNKCEEKLLQDISHRIYNETTRAASFFLATKEYIDKVIANNGLDIDGLIKEVLRDLSDKPRYAKKIDTVMLSELLSCSENEDDRIYQEKIIALFTREKLRYLTTDETIAMVQETA